MPDLADEQSVRIYGLYGFAEFFPEGVTDLVSHVKPPAINPEILYVVAGYIDYIRSSLRI